MKKIVCIQGLGFVGSAMALAVAMANDENGEPLYDVIGIDLPTSAGMNRVSAINAGVFPFKTNDLSLKGAMLEVRRRGNLRATTNEELYRRADTIVVDIHLDISFYDTEPVLDLKHFRDSVSVVGRHMRPDALVIIETTVPPGTCDKIVMPSLSENFRQRGLDPSCILLAHSYERVMPGKDYLDSVINNWRVYSGSTKQAADACALFLSSVINSKEFPLTRLKSMLASETAKVLENTYRTVNIAFIHEWTKYAEGIGIDLFEVINAIQKRPTHINIRYPGLGIGGYCLTKDPTFAPAAASQLFGLSLEFPFSKLAVAESARMPFHTIDRLCKLLGGSLSGKKILLCGLSYRQDVADTRFSPSETVYHALKDGGAQVDLHDPFVSFWEEVGCEISSTLPSAKLYDAIIFAIPHQLYQKLDLSNWLGSNSKTLILDAFSVFTSEQRNNFRSEGVFIEAIGVGDGL